MQDRSDRKTANPVMMRPSSPAPAMADGRLTLAELLLRLGAVDRAVVTGFLAPVDGDKLVESGARLATDRVVDGGQAVVALAVAFVGRATAAQRALMPSLTGQFLSATVTTLSLAHDEQRLLDAGRKGSAELRDGTGAVATRELRAARARREVFHAALAPLAPDPEAKEALDRAYGTAADGREACTALTDMVALGPSFVASAQARGVTTSLGEAYFAETLAIAAAARRAHDKAEGVAIVAQASQQSVNWWDGAALWFVARLVDMFDAAHKADPTIPRLPLGKLRAVLRRTSASKRNRAKAPPAPPAPPA